METSLPTQTIESAPLNKQGGNSSRRAARPTFAIACWVMGLLAFAQLITVGSAVAIRGIKPPQKLVVSAAPSIVTPQGPIQPRSIEEILNSIKDSKDPLDPLPTTQGHSPHHVQNQPFIPNHTRPLSHTSRRLPAIANPRVERLVQEAKTLSMDGDMMRSMLKLDEAARLDPKEPAVIYQKAKLFEEMGIYVKAADQYQRIQQMGTQAGVYFQLAAKKLTQGMDTAQARRNVISIGPMQTRKTPSLGSGGVRHAEVAISILARPDEAINPADVHVQIHFYDKVNGGEIKKASTAASIESRWTDSKLDWKDEGNEEHLRISYTIPQADLADEHLLGRREFYGYVVELVYKGEVIDQQAHPRRLHSVHGSKMAPVPQTEDPMPWLPDDNEMLLPSRNYSLDDTSLPTR